MKERPIIFSGEMVRAILNGRKTQTRRVVKDQFRKIPHGVVSRRSDDWVHTYSTEFRLYLDVIKCPYGVPGDRLWVRETHIQYADGRCIYKADHNDLDAAGLGGMYGGWRPSIHMPRSASRLLLEVTDVRVERVQDISEEDAKTEGVASVGACFRNYSAPDMPFEFARTSFFTLWDSINAERGYGWDANPWVWVVEFKVVSE